MLRPLPSPALRRVVLLGALLSSGLRAQTITFTATQDRSTPITTTTLTTLTLASGAATQSGDIDGGGAIAKTGAGTITLTGATGHTGGTTVSGGVLDFNGVADQTLSGSVSISGASSFLRKSGTSTLAFNNVTVSGSGSGGVNLVSGATLDVPDGSSSSIGAPLTGGGLIHVAPTGSLALTQSSSALDATFTGSGALTLGNGARIGASTVLSGFTGTIIGPSVGTLTVDAGASLPSLSFGGTVALGTSGTAVTLGTVTMSASTAALTTSSSAQAVTIGAGSTLQGTKSGAGSLTLGSGVNVPFGNSFAVTGGSVAGGSLNVDGTFSFSGGGTLSTSVSGSGTLNLTEGTLSGSPSLTTTTINGPSTGKVLTVASDLTLPSLTNWAGRLSVTGNSNVTLGTVSMVTAAQGTTTATLAGGSLTINGGTLRGTFTSTAAATMALTGTVAAGTGLTVSGATTTLNGGGITAASGAAFTLTGGAKADGVTFAGLGTYNFDGGATITSNTTIAAMGTLNGPIAGNTLNLDSGSAGLSLPRLGWAGTLATKGNVTIANAVMGASSAINLASGATLTIDGTSLQGTIAGVNGGGNFATITSTLGAGTLSLGNLTVAGTITVNAPATLSLGAGSIVSVPSTNLGNGGSGTVQLNGVTVPTGATISATTINGPNSGITTTLEAPTTFSSLANWNGTISITGTGSATIGNAIMSSATATATVGSDATLDLSGTLRGTLNNGGHANSVGGTVASGSTFTVTNGTAVPGASALTVAGTLAAQSSGILRTDVIASNSTGTISLASGGTLDLYGLPFTPGSTVTLSGTGGTILNSVAATDSRLTLARPATLASAVTDGAGTVSLEKTGGSTTVTLSGANTYTGTTTVSAGTLAIAHAQSLGATSSGTTVADGAALQLQGGIAVGAEPLSLTGTGVSGTGALRNASGTNSFAGAITLTAATTIQSDAGSLALSGAISGSQALTLAGAGNGSVDGIFSGTSLTKTGAGTWTLSSTPTYTGATNIVGGTLALSGNNRLPSASAISLTNGAMLDLGGSSQFLHQLGTSSAPVAGNITAGTLTLTDTQSYLQSGTFNNDFAGTGANARLWIGGDASATVTLNGSNNLVYTTDHNQLIIGYVVTGAAGTVKLGSPTALAAATENVQIFSGTLDLNGQANVRGKSLTFKSSADGALVNNSVTAASFNGAVSMDTLVNAGLGGSGDFALGGVVMGNGGLIKSGAGTVTLSGANLYFGTTTINAGTLSIAHNTALGAVTGTGTIVASGATLALSGGITVGTEALSLSGPGVGGNGALRSTSGTNTWNGLITLAGDATIDVDAGSLAFTNTGTITSSGRSLTLAGAGTGSLATKLGTGSGALTKTGSGTWTLTGASTYTGATTISGGTLRLGDGTRFSTATSGITNNGALVVDGGGFYSGVISGSGTVTKLGDTTSTLVLTADNTFAGDLVISSGTVQLGSASATGTVGGNIVNNGTLFFDRSGNTTYAGNISGSGSVGIIGYNTGVFTLSGDNSFTGGVNLIAPSNQTPSVQLGSTNALGSSGTIKFIGGTLQYSAANATDYSGRFSTDASQAYRIDTNGRDVTFASALTSSGGTLTKLGAGTLTLSAASTYTGATTVSGGTLQLGDGTTASLASSNIVNNAAVAFAGAGSYGGVISGTGTLAKSGSGTFALSADQTYTGRTTISGGTLQLGDGTRFSTATSGITNNGALVFDGGDFYSGVISGSGTVTKQGDTTSTLFLTADNTFAGDLVISSGTVQLGSASATGTVGGNIVNNGTLFFDRSGNTTYAGNISGSGSVGIIGYNTGVFTLSGDNSFTGGVNLIAPSNQTPSVQLGSTNALGSSGTIKFIGGTLQYSAANATDYSSRFSTDANQAYRIDTHGRDVTFASALTSSGGTLTKLGAGTLTLSAGNTFGGATTVAAGTLLVNGSLAGAVNVAAGATLGGTGNIGGLASVASGGTLAPGSSPGTLTFANGLTLAAGAVLDFQLGSSSDLIAVTGGTLTGPGGTGGLTLNLSDAGGFGPGTYTLFTFINGGTSSFEAEDFTLGTLARGSLGDYALNLGATSLTLTYTASVIPEPSTCAALAGAAMLGFAAWRRQRRSATSRSGKRGPE